MVTKDPPVLGEKVLVAMSGGVDSSVAALLLRDAGYNTTGITLKLFQNEDIAWFVEDEDVLGNDSPDSDPQTLMGRMPVKREPRTLRDTEQSWNLGEPTVTKTCCALSDVEDARQVCQRLDIPHLTFNFTGSFGTEVIDRFCTGYLSGLTPNPCIDCNRYVKFEALQKRRRELSYDYVATGHYARRSFDSVSGRYLLKTGDDPTKDQSYVLFHITQNCLAHMLFPVGELTKSQVREMALRARFINAEKPDSQDICFVPRGDYSRFIAHRTGLTDEPGDIVDRSGKILGRHDGLVHYTIGQRKGIGVAASEPLYVYEKDMIRNRLVVGFASEIMVSKVEVSDINLIALEKLDSPLRVTAKTHYRQKAQPAMVEQTSDDTLLLTFAEPIRVCAPGQAAVIYLDDVVLGGGTIVRSY